MMSLVSALPLMTLMVSSALALPLTSNEVKLREIAVGESKPELLRTAVKYARYILLYLIIMITLVSDLLTPQT